MANPLQQAILSAIARDGSVASIEARGYTSAQIAAAVREMVANGDLVRRDARFYVGEHAVIQQERRGALKALQPLSEYAIEKIGQNDQYVIGHQTFTQIRERVRP